MSAVVLVSLHYYRYVTAVIDKEHTDDTLDDMAKLGFSFIELLRSGPLKDLHDNWRFPKFHLMACHMLEAWMELGHPSNYSMEPYEKSHHPIKDDHRNGSNNERTRQTARNSDRRLVDTR